jgi:ankyrin repeat protein
MDASWQSMAVENNRTDGDILLPSHCLQMLQQGCDINCFDYDGRTGLMLAASKGHLLAVKQLVAAGAAVNATDHQGTTALLEAVKAGHDDVIE